MRYEGLKPSRGLIATDPGTTRRVRSGRLSNRRKRSGSDGFPKSRIEHALSTQALRFGPGKEDDDGYLRFDWSQPEIPRTT